MDINGRKRTAVYGAARPETCGSLTKRVMMINLEVGGLLEVTR